MSQTTLTNCVPNFGFSVPPEKKKHALSVRHCKKCQLQHVFDDENYIKNVHTATNVLITKAQAHFGLCYSSAQDKHAKKSNVPNLSSPMYLFTLKWHAFPEQLKFVFVKEKRMNRRNSF